MKECEEDSWYLPQSLDITSLTHSNIPKLFFEVGQPHDRICTYFDTFDWRLYRLGFFLQYSAGMWSLANNSADSIESANGPKPDTRIFSWDFPTGQLHTLLKPILDTRALLPLLTRNLSTTPVNILNKDTKTVARLFFEQCQTHGSKAILRTLKLQGVRGYDKQKQSVRNLLRSHGITVKASPLTDFIEAVKTTGRTPGDYTSKFSIKLNQDDTARQAVVKIYKQLLTTMRLNEKGIITDLDSEFLHDFRVAIRRTRSGLSQIKNVLPLEITEHFKKSFARFGRLTGPTRDLDVYLLYEDDYKSRLPPTLQTALHTFFADITKRRNNEQQKLSTFLASKQYNQAIRSWQQYLATDDNTRVADADIAVIDIAQKTIFRRYKKIIKDGMAISSDTPDEDLHRLRIQGKKLRYNLEFFSSLFPKNDIKLLIKQLKRLQDNLGTFNDLSVQQDMLQQYLGELQPGSRKNFELAVAIGGLLTNLYHEQHQVRDDFSLTFKRFSNPKNMALFNKLFNSRSV